VTEKIHAFDLIFSAVDLEFTHTLQILRSLLPISRVKPGNACHMDFFAVL